ncbi:MAG: hypothetical protein ACE14V_11080 [bacterium]
MNIGFFLSSFSDELYKATAYPSICKRFPLFAFILATPADKNVFPELLLYFPELHCLTENRIFVFAPKINIPLPFNLLKECTEETEFITKYSYEVSKVLATKRYYSPDARKFVDKSEAINDFLEKQMQETYAFVRFIGLDLNKLPCILFFDNLNPLREYILWSLKGSSASEVIKDFRSILEVIEKAKHRDNNYKLLEVIYNLNKKRFILRVLSELKELAPFVASLFGT